MTKKIALVTGGTRGIGEEISVALDAVGYTVAANYGGNDEAAKAFTKKTGIKAFKFDVANYDACEKGVHKIEKELGGSIDVLVNNAGITRDGTLHKMTSAQWDEVIAVNLTSVFNLSRLTYPGMRERGFGRIINISSVNGRKGQFGQTNYAAAKAGMIGFTKSLALEGAAKGVTCNVVAPGYINTDMVAAMHADVLEAIVKQIPAGRLGTVSEIARAVVFLADKNAGFINGATLDINGAQYLG